MDKLLAHRKSQNPKPGLTLYVLRAFAVAFRAAGSRWFLDGDEDCSSESI